MSSLDLMEAYFRWTNNKASSAEDIADWTGLSINEVRIVLWEDPTGAFLRYNDKWLLGEMW